MAILEGKKGLVFGVANDRSYAWHIAKAVLEHGGSCAFSCLPGEKNVRRTGKAVEKLGAENPWVQPCDAGSDADIDAIFDAYEKDHGRLDFVVHSIAFADRAWLAPGVFAQTPREAYLAAVDISAYTLVAMGRRAAPIMEKNGGGSIVAMSYYGAEKVVSGYNVMGVAKAALEASTRYLAEDLGQKNIRVNAISGGAFRTLAASAVGGIDSMLDAAPTKAPLRRNVQGQDVGGTAAYLLSELSSGVTGETIYVDCGINILGA